MTRLTDIWLSFRSIPVWVQLWVVIILFPMNLGGLFFLDAPAGRIAALLGIGGMLPNLLIIWFQRGFSRAMAFPHLPIWTPLVIWLAWIFTTAPPQGNFGFYLAVLLAVDVISLGFDYTDAWKWIKGDRAVSRPALS